MAVAPPQPASGDELRYLGAIDNRQPPVLSGWAISSACLAAPITIEVEGQTPVVVQSANPRPDLAAKNLSPGDGGWQFDIASRLGPDGATVHLRFPDGSPMPGSPLQFGKPRQAEPAAAPPAPVAEIAPAPPPPPKPIDAAKLARHSAPRVSFAPANPQPAAPQPEPEPESVETPQPPAAPAAVATPPPPPAQKPPAKASDPISLAELDEISLDDFALALENGTIHVEPPPPPPPIEVEQPVEQPPAPTPRRKGFLSRLLGQ